MLPLWIRGGRPVVRLRPHGHAFSVHVAHAQNIPFGNHALPVPLVPLLLLCVGLGYIFASWTGSGHAQRPAGLTTSPFLIPSSKFLPPPPPPARPDYIPAPVAPKRSGMVVPNAVHYVYGLKPVPPGGQPEELPYYAYLAIRSALINLKPEKMFL